MPPPPASLDGDQQDASQADRGSHLSDSGFTADLERLSEAAQAASQPLTIGELETILQGRGMVTLTLVFALPFVQPIPVPGLSIILGIVIMALGLKLAFGSHGNLPDFIRRKSLAPATVQKMARGGKKIFTKLEKLFKKRYSFAADRPLSQIAGVSLMACGIAMALPLPPVILFSNSLPAIAVIFICLGFIERDGLFILAGHAMALVTWIYFAFWWELIWAAITHIPEVFPSLLKKWEACEDLIFCWFKG